MPFGAASTGPVRDVHAWIGGKSRIVEALFALLPRRPSGRWRRWIEPFYGSGASLRAAIDRDLADAYLAGDACADLVAAHLWARDDPDGLLAAVRALDGGAGVDLAAHRARFTAVREGRVPADRAARFLYLVGGAYNALWRVSARGRHNAPPGLRFRLDEALLRESAVYLRQPNVHLLRADFAALLRRAGAGDLVYCDPPYADNFSAYVPGGFPHAEHLRLAVALRAAVARGARCYVSNSDTPEARSVYRGRVHVLTAHRSVSCKGTGRGEETEILVEVV